MRRLIWALIGLAVLYSLYWVAVAQVLAAAPHRAADGTALTTGSVATTGYPVRFDMAVTDLRIARGDWVWDAPQVGLRADSYRPWAIAVDLPQDHSITLPAQILQVSSPDFQASLALQPNLQLGFDTGHLAIGPSQITSDAGWQAGLAQMRADLARQAATEATYAAELTLDSVTLPASLRDRIDPAAALGAEIAAIDAAAKLSFAQPLDRDLQGRVPDLDQITLDHLRLTWGQVTLDLAGEVTIDAQGLPTGRIIAQTRQWQIVLDLLVNAGLIDSRVSATVTRLARFMADGDGRLAVPVSFQDGMMLLGPVPVGPAPRLR